MDIPIALRTTLEQATPLTRGIFGGASGLSAEEVVGFITGSPVALVSTVDAHGAPHVAGSGVVLVGGRLYVGVSPDSAMRRNLRREPRVALAFTDPPWKRHVLIQGSVRFLKRGDAEERRAGAQYKAAHGWEAGELAEVELRKVFTWKG